MNDETIDSCPLDDATLELMAEAMQQIKAFHAYREGVLALFSRQHKLAQGDWQLSGDGKELRRVDGRNRVNGPQAQPAIMETGK